MGLIMGAVARVRMCDAGASVRQHAFGPDMHLKSPEELNTFCLKCVMHVLVSCGKLVRFTILHGAPAAHCVMLCYMAAVLASAVTLYAIWLAQGDLRKE